MDPLKQDEIRMDLSSQGINNLFAASYLVRTQTNLCKHLDLSGNEFENISDGELSPFHYLETLDLSSNRLQCLPCGLCKLTKLKRLLIRNNLLYDLPKCFASFKCLKVLNMSGNRFQDFPKQILEFNQLKELHLGGNGIHQVPKEIANLSSLEFLYLGGNKLKELPVEMGKLASLKFLNLCDNRITILPKELAKLHQLESLSLHNNNLTVLPNAIVKLKNLQAISVRGNPLVIRFVRSQCSRVPSLQELSGRKIKSCQIPYSEEMLPAFFVKYLNSAKKCVNPKCHGVFFDSGFRHIKFVDFCGKYRLPFEQFLCSPHENEQWEDVSSSTSSEDDDYGVEPSWMRRILLG